MNLYNCISALWVDEVGADLYDLPEDVEPISQMADFLWILFLVALVAAALAACVVVCRMRRLRRLTNPVKDHVYKRGADRR